MRVHNFLPMRSGGMEFFMKKSTKLVLISAMALSMLTGCYKQDTKITVGPLGGAKAEISFAGTDAAVGEVSGGASYDELMDTILPQIENMQKDEGNSSVDVQKIQEDLNGQTINGVKYTAKFASINDMLSSNLFLAFNGSVASPVTSESSARQGVGIGLKAKQHWYGTEYFANGTISLTQGSDISDEEKAQLSDASISVKINFPFSSFTTYGKENKGFLTPVFKYTANAENPEVPVNFYVFAPNIMMLLGIIIIIALAIFATMLMKKNRALESKLKGDDETCSCDCDLSADDENFFEGSDETEEFNDSEATETPETEDKSEDDE